MIVIKNNIIPFGSYKAINICGIVFTKSELNDRTRNHEAIHTKQMLEMLIIGFYIWYIIEYIIVRFFHKKQSDAYKDISLEEEARANQYNYNYLKERKHYSWWKYINVKSNKTK